ncbi:hypothetical protein KDA_59860 [Dictyobacter alpinus]|uniref:HNH domain-containing protein n=2 Tax=Dictyobacter alpinus TaxID=2014873 RepID=A0A402BGY7_9CHLR|nr:hypothetical protein KDA_59860 [Dictyobacter alpinus]
MFGPLRFNKLLKAIPGLDHLSLTPQAAHHAKSHIYEHVKEEIKVDKVQHSSKGNKATHIHEDIVKDVKVDTQRGAHTASRQKKVTEDIKVTKIEQVGDEVVETLTHVHATSFDVAEIEMTPPHPPRESTPIYIRTHNRLVNKLDTPCAICGVRKSTLKDPGENPFHAKDIETHHYPIERSLLNACDPKKLRVTFPQIKDHQTLEEFIDSEDNIMVLCDIHHRHPHYGIHHLLAQDFFIQPYLYSGYQVVAEVEEQAKIMAANERVIKRHGAKN